MLEKCMGQLLRRLRIAAYNCILIAIVCYASMLSSCDSRLIGCIYNVAGIMYACNLLSTYKSILLALACIAV